MSLTDSSHPLLNPLIGVLADLIARGGSMHERAAGRTGGG
jgi:hypothetical protein